MKNGVNGRHVSLSVAHLLALLVLVALLASGCGTAGNIMTKAPRISQPPQDKALVTFVRPSIVGGAVTFGIWDSENLVGVMNAGKCIQYQAAPGEHYFLARAENWSCVKADLAPGKHYVIKTNPMFGVWKARVAFDPITAADYQKQLKDVRKWLATLEPVSPDPGQSEAYAQARRAEVLKAKSEFQSGKGQYVTLAPQDCLPE